MLSVSIIPRSTSFCATLHMVMIWFRPRLASALGSVPRAEGQRSRIYTLEKATILTRMVQRQKLGKEGNGQTYMIVQA